MKKVVIGARGSKLSLIQTEIVKKKLNKVFPDLGVEVKVITTKGDKNLNPVPLDSVGKGWFTEEIDQQLLDGKIDLAVHSLKDLPEELENGLIIASTPEREDPRDALISQGNLLLKDLKNGAVVGTDSTRRGSQVLHLRPDLVVKSLRGNVDSRVRKLEEGEFDAVILAVAGLLRLGLENKITEYFEAKDFIPAPGQGALAVVTNKTNQKLNQMLREISDEEAEISVNAERAFSKKIGGGCKMPVGAFAEVNGGKLVIYGFVGSLDGKNIVKDFIEGDKDNPEELGKKLAKTLLEKSKPWFQR